MLLLSSAVLLFNMIFLAVLAPLLPMLAGRFALSKAGAGLLVATYAGGVMLAAIPAGVVVRRLGEQRTVVVGLAITSAASIAFALVPAAWALDLARLGQGIGTATSWSGVVAWLLAAAPAGRRAGQIGTAMGAAVVGALLGPVLGGVAALVGMATALLPTATVGFALAGWAWTLRPPARRDHERAARPATRGSRRVLAAGLWLGTLTALNSGILSVLGPLKLHRLGAGSLVISVTFLTSAVVQSGWNPMLGRLLDRRGRLWPIRAALAGAATIAFAFPFVNERWTLCTLVVLGGLTASGFWIAGLTLVADGSGAAGSSYGAGLTLMNLVWAAGSLVGAGLGGKLAGSVGDAVPLFGLAAICFVTLGATRLWRSTAVVSRARGSLRYVTSARKD